MTMIFRTTTAATLLLALPLSLQPLLVASESAHAETIGDGRTLEGWEGSAKTWHDSWRIDNGVIIGEIPAGGNLPRNEFLFWKDEVHDFDLTVEYRITGVPSANSGIQYRTKRLDDGEAKGYQADLDDGATWLGRVYEENGRGVIAERGSRVSIAPDGRRWVDAFATPSSLRAFVHVGEWNTYHVRVAASHSELWINDVLFSSLDDHQAGAAALSGRIAFQLHAGPGPSKIEFRNIRFQNLGASEPENAAGKASAASAPAESAGIKPVGPDGKTLNLDFETGTLTGWKAEGNAWEGQPIKGDTVSPRKPGMSSNHTGDYWLGGYEKVGDEGTGTLTSSVFAVNHPWASFLIGGGHDPKQERLELVEDGTGRIIHTASGADTETMHREVVNLEAEQGKRIFIRITDAGTGGWGHINYDDFLFHDKAPVFAQAPTTGNRQSDSPMLWALEPNPAKPTAVANPSAQKLVAGMMLTHGFQAELIAAEPEVRQPIAFTIDERGRIWVAEAYSYPNKQPEGKGLDRIVIFEDPDGDGTFKKRKVFIEGLNLVSGLEVGYGGVWVGAAPQLLFIPDRNHRDIPDGPPEVMLDGWGLGDTHETLNSFIWGPDGWLYGNQGVFNRASIGKPGTPQENRVQLMAGVWRYHPLRHEFQIFAHGGSNQWGLDFNEVGHLFMTHCRSFYGGGGTSFVIRNGFYWNQVNANYDPFISNAGPDFAPELKNYLPASAEYDTGEGGAGKPGTGAVYGGHAKVGTLVYLGDNWPDIYRDHVFTNNIFGAQLNHQENVREGSGYLTLQAGYDMAWSPDPTYLPVSLKTGPDGAVYVIDWADTQHCHTPDREKWDRTTGRLYRISWAKTFQPKKVDLGAMSDIDLVHLQSHHNDWYCRTAQRLLSERAAAGKLDPQAVAALKELLATSTSTPQVLRALWCLHTTASLDNAVLAHAAQHGSDVVRAWAVQLGTESGPSEALPADALVRLATSDPSPVVRLALASALPVLPTAPLWDVANALAAHGEDAKDRFLPKMIWFGLAHATSQDYARALALSAKTSLPTLADSIRWFAGNQAQGRDQLVGQIATADEASAYKGLRLLAYALKNEASVPLPKGWAEVQTHLASAPAEAKALVDQLSVLFGDQAVLTRTRAILADEKAPIADRRAAFELLKRSGDPQATPVYAGLLDLDAFRSDVIPLLARSNDPATAQALLKRYASFSESDRALTLNTLTARSNLAMPLLKAVADGTFDKKQLSAMQIRQLRTLNDAEINRILDQSWGKITDVSASAKTTIAKLKKAYVDARLGPASSEAGQKVFQRTCTVCHAMNGVGAHLGPDLGGSWRNGVDYFLENIVDPNAVVGDDYQLHVVTRTDGSVVLGLLDHESDTTLVIKSLSRTTSIPKSEIKDRKKMAQSLMPVGLLESMPERDALELLKFLTTKN
jgi:putative membrane-bound dehydrogenase-like protein